MTTDLHLITCEYPPVIGGVSEHSRVIAEAAAAEGYDVHVWTAQRGADARRIHVRPALGNFSAAALAEADAALNLWRTPRRLVVQWVPHGYGRKGLNVGFSRWLRRRARGGDRIDLIVHEPFIDFFGGSWRQPAAALIQRYMTWMAMRAADRVWLTIPGWEPRLRLARRRGQPPPRTLPVPGTIPPVHDAEGVAALRATLLDGRARLVGYFGAGGRYSFEALRATLVELAPTDTAFVCIGRGSDTLAADLRSTVSDGSIPVTGTGAVDRGRVSLHLQACDALVQPYADGVSGRRTTTISALEHAIPVATTIGWLSEPFWSETTAIEAVPAAAASTIPSALLKLLEPARNAAARAGAAALYRERFDPARTMKALLRAPDPSETVSKPLGGGRERAQRVSHASGAGHGAPPSERAGEFEGRSPSTE